MMQYTGACKFCGQIKMISAGDGLEENEIIHLASLQCACDEARAYQKVDQKKTYAEANIKQLFSEDEKAFTDIMLSAVGFLANMTIKKMSLTNEYGVRATLTAKENSIKVERVATDKNVLED